MTGMRPDDPMRRSGAVWCDQHGRWECSKSAKRTKVRCHQPAIRGTAACRQHVGTSTELAKSKGQANLLAWSLVANASEPNMDPASVVMQAIRVTYHRLELLGAMLQAQLERQKTIGLVGPTYAAGRAGERVQTGEQLRALTRLEADERQLLVRFAKTAHDMGISERQLELEQAQAAQVVTAVGAGLEALSLDGEQRDRFLAAFLGALGRPAPGSPALPPVVGEVTDGGAA